MQVQTARYKPDSPYRTHLRVVTAMIRREMTTRYGRSAGGYFWAVAEPVGMIAMLSLAFSALSRTPDLGTSFIVFFATGFLPFNFYRFAAQQVASSVRASRPLLGFPNVTIFDAMLARLILQTLTSSFVAALVLGAAVAITGERIALDFGLIALAISAATLLGFGVGVVNAVLFTLSGTYEQIFGIVNRPLFLISGVLYTPEIMPASVRDLLALNPLVHIVALFREGIYPVYYASVNSFAFPALCGLSLTLLGLLLLRRFSQELMQR